MQTKNGLDPASDSVNRKLWSWPPWSTRRKKWLWKYKLSHSRPRRSGHPAESPFWAEQTEQPHGHRNEACQSLHPSVPVPRESDSGAHPADMRPSNMLRKTRWPVETPPPPADQTPRSSAGTGEDSSIRQAGWTVLVISQRQEISPTKKISQIKRFFLMDVSKIKCFGGPYRRSSSMVRILYIACHKWELVIWP